MRLAPQHIEGTPERQIGAWLGLEVDYTPECAWPDACMVQWGHGLVPATPFFEAFPGGAFIRGEGTTITEAERQAFAQYERDLACNHTWGRWRNERAGIYTNGAGWCRKCGGFRSKMFQPIFELGQWRKPLSLMEKDWLDSMMTDPELNERMDRKYPHERASRLKIERLLKLRLVLFGARARD